MVGYGMLNTEAEVLAHHGITDVWSQHVVSVCLSCGTIAVAPDEESHAAYAALADQSEEWCCGPVIVYTPEVNINARNNHGLRDGVRS